MPITLPNYDFNVEPYIKKCLISYTLKVLLFIYYKRLFALKNLFQFSRCELDMLDKLYAILIIYFQKNYNYELTLFIRVIKLYKIITLKYQVRKLQITRDIITPFNSLNERIVTF